MMGDERFDGGGSPVVKKAFDLEILTPHAGATVGSTFRVAGTVQPTTTPVTASATSKTTSTSFPGTPATMLPAGEWGFSFTVLAPDDYVVTVCAGTVQVPPQVCKSVDPVHVA
jgi:hypothetical protein